MEKDTLIKYLKEALDMWPTTCCGCGCCCGINHGKDSDRLDEIKSELRKDGIDI